MKYEICKGIIDQDGQLLWSVIAWTDVRSYGKSIIDALSFSEDYQYAVLDRGKVIYQK